MSLNELLSDGVKPWANFRCDDLTVDGPLKSISASAQNGYGLHYIGNGNARFIPPLVVREIPYDQYYFTPLSAVTSASSLVVVASPLPSTNFTVVAGELECDVAGFYFLDYNISCDIEAVASIIVTVNVNGAPVAQGVLGMPLLANLAQSSSSQTCSKNTILDLDVADVVSFTYTLAPVAGPFTSSPITGSSSIQLLKVA